MRERTYQFNPTQTALVRQQAGWQVETARELNISRQRLNLWLSGKNAVPESYFQKLCQKIGKTPFELVTPECQKFLLNVLI